MKQITGSKAKQQLLHVLNKKKLDHNTCVFYVIQFGERQRNKFSYSILIYLLSYILN